MPKTAATTCVFIDSFGDRCLSRPQHGDTMCPEHGGTPCCECGGQATQACQLPGPAGGPCGFPLCARDRCPRDHGVKWHK